MEPWPPSHGYIIAEKFISVILIWLQWSHGLPAMDTTVILSIFTEKVGLQWSHGLPAMDTRWKGFIWISIQVLQWSHGLPAMDTMEKFSEGDVLTVASMEPWPPSHGYMNRTAALAGYAPRLQWSHGLPAMDTSPCSPPCCRLMRLQWSHGLPAMDTRPEPPETVRTASGFNGAMASQPWIPGKHGIAVPGFVASMEPWPPSHGYWGCYGSENYFPIDASMEPWPPSHGYRTPRA